MVQEGQGGIREEMRSRGKQDRGVGLQVTHCRAWAFPLHMIGGSGVDALRMHFTHYSGYVAHSGAWKGVAVCSLFRWSLRNKKHWLGRRLIVMCSQSGLVVCG